MERDDQIMDDMLRNAAASPADYPINLWGRIQSRRKLKRIRTPLAIAASIMLLIWVTIPAKKDTANLELKAELESSSLALNDINKQIRLFGNDEQLLRAKSRIEAYRARIAKAMQ